MLRSFDGIGEIQTYRTDWRYFQALIIAKYVARLFFLSFYFIFFFYYNFFMLLNNYVQFGQQNV